MTGLHRPAGAIPHHAIAARAPRIFCPTAHRVREGQPPRRCASVRAASRSLPTRPGPPGPQAPTRDLRRPGARPGGGAAPRGASEPPPAGHRPRPPGLRSSPGTTARSGTRPPRPGRDCKPEWPPDSGRRPQCVEERLQHSEVGMAMVAVDAPPPGGRTIGRPVGVKSVHRRPAWRAPRGQGPADRRCGPPRRGRGRGRQSSGAKGGGGAAAAHLVGEGRSRPGRQPFVGGRNRSAEMSGRPAGVGDRPSRAPGPAAPPTVAAPAMSPAGGSAPVTCQRRQERPGESGWAARPAPDPASAERICPALPYGRAGGARRRSAGGRRRRSAERWSPPASRASPGTG